VTGRKLSDLGARMGQRRKNERIYFELVGLPRGDGPKGIGQHIKNRNSLCNTFSADLNKIQSLNLNKTHF
jgi:hypothetical protein